ncbi:MULTISPECIES: heme ABC transporter ATP-binding protein [Ureibacillus]|jgi:iron complex transport system ATP-binding protein|uniref:heme ABC transporter ATP-binding protein n=1 Tax=Ureibacillus TaxID=160795 RepID=UPI000BBBE2A4|nr:heme ABC transporter ATP-binding protein [Ureibacillus thermosphaericus]
MKLAIEHVSCTIMETSIIQDISIHIKDGQFVGIIGPNGSGKSTLLKIASRILKPNAGAVRLDGQHLYELSPKKAAQEIAVVSQETSLTFDFSVQEIVLMGRNPHKRLFQSDTDEDLRIVNEALERVGMQGYEERSFMSLSGGEKQRVLIARALAQQAKLIILDEPTNHLDIRHQLQLMDLVKKLNVTVLAALHDLNLASNYCDYLYVIQNGQVVMSGTPESVLTKDRIREVFGVETEIIIHPLTKKPYITFLTHV